MRIMLIDLKKINFDENIKRDIFEFLLESFFLAY